MFDKEHEFPGMVYLLEPDVHISMEQRAYGIEIEKALNAGYNELAEKLKENLLKEEASINDDFGSD